MRRKQTDFVWEPAATPSEEQSKPGSSRRVPLSVAAVAILAGISASIWAVEDVASGGSSGGGSSVAAPAAAGVPRLGPPTATAIASTQEPVPQVPVVVSSKPAASRTPAATVRTTTRTTAPAATTTQAAALATTTQAPAAAPAAKPTTTTATTTAATSEAPAAPSTCSAAPWATSTAYVRGDEVAYGGRLWSANQWNYNEVPGGAAGAWDAVGTC